jgi:hypothetical protein
VGERGVDEREPERDEEQSAPNFMRSAKAPTVSAGVMIAKGHLEGREDRFRDRPDDGLPA